jgi:hypothetical protein
MYWISGKPGAGKTTLTKYILRSLEKQPGLIAWDRPPTIVSHFFWKPATDPMAKNRKGFLCSVLYQLLNGNRAAMDRVLKKHGGVARMQTTECWSVANLEQCVELLLQDGMPVFMLADGVDEMDSPREQEETLQFLARLHETSPTTLKVCVSSRPEPIFQSFLKDCPCLRVQDLTYRDLLIYARGNIPDYHFFGRPMHDFTRDTMYLRDQQHLAKHIVARAEGVFLWVCLVVQSLRMGSMNCDTVDEIHHRLSRLPSDLGDFYQTMWQRQRQVDGGCYETSLPFLAKAMVLRDQSNCGRDSLPHNDSTVICSLTVSLLMDQGLVKGVMEASSPHSLCALTRRLQEQHGAVERRLYVRSGGFIKIAPGRLPSRDAIKVHPHCSACKWTPESYTPQRCTWIHRTAFDFFSDTQLGKTILAADGLEEHVVESRFMVALLARECLAPRSNFELLDQLLAYIKPKHARVAARIIEPFFVHTYNLLLPRWDTPLMALLQYVATPKRRWDLIILAAALHTRSHSAILDLVDTDFISSHEVSQDIIDQTAHALSTAGYLDNPWDRPGWAILRWYQKYTDGEIDWHKPSLPPPTSAKNITTQTHSDTTLTHLARSALLQSIQGNEEHANNLEWVLKYAVSNNVRRPRNVHCDICHSLTPIPIDFSIMLSLPFNNTVDFKDPPDAELTCPFQVLPPFHLGSKPAIRSHLDGKLFLLQYQMSLADLVDVILRRPDAAVFCNGSHGAHDSTAAEYIGSSHNQATLRASNQPRPTISEIYDIQIEHDQVTLHERDVPAKQRQCTANAMYHHIYAIRRLHQINAPAIHYQALSARHLPWLFSAGQTGRRIVLDL